MQYIPSLKREEGEALSIIHAISIEARNLNALITEFAHDGADAHIDALAKKYLGVDEYPLRNPDEQRVIVKIAPA